MAKVYYHGKEMVWCDRCGEYIFLGHDHYQSKCPCGCDKDPDLKRNSTAKHGDR